MSVRESSKERRRQSILDAARRMLAKGGYRALNVRALAKEADVTLPTLYNLIGNKEKILFELAAQTMRVIGQRSFTPDTFDPDDPFTFIDSGIAVSADLFAEQPDFYRSAFVAVTFADNQELFWSPQSMFVQGGAEIPTRCCRAVADAGMLEGRFSPSALGMHIFQGVRGALRDWSVGLISLEDYRRWSLRCGYAGLLLDAREPLRSGLLERLAALYEPPQ
ncbi:MAG: TetR/AcrR family transcriptional regulator [Deltaproteobacteria bacterium]|nr:TetR/AcrR family transcriptional regulator [Deltaproteobacteria bacterium]